MNILKLLDVIEWSIEDAKQHDDGLAAVRGFTVSALYKVAEHYRKTNNMPPLLYTQPIYYMKEQKHADYH